MRNHYIFLCSNINAVLFPFSHVHLRISSTEQYRKSAYSSTEPVHRCARFLGFLLNVDAMSSQLVDLGVWWVWQVGDVCIWVWVGGDTEVRELTDSRLLRKV